MFLNAIFDWGQSWRLISLLIHQNKLRYCVDLHRDSCKAAEQTTLHHTHFPADNPPLSKASFDLRSAKPHMHSVSIPVSHSSSRVASLSLSCVTLLLPLSSCTCFSRHACEFSITLTANFSFDVCCHTTQRGKSHRVIAKWRKENFTSTFWTLNNTVYKLKVVCMPLSLFSPVFPPSLSPVSLSLFLPLPRSASICLFLWVSADLSTCQRFLKTGPCAFLALSPFLSCRFSPLFLC